MLCGLVFVCQFFLPLTLSTFTIIYTIQQDARDRVHRDEEK
jgi:hypothetical protein